LGDSHFSLNEYKKAIDYYKRSLEVSGAIGDQSGMANNNGCLGDSYVKINEYEKAISCYEACLKIRTAIGEIDHSKIEHYIVNLGGAYLGLGKYEKAIHYCKEGLEICTANGNRSGTSTCFGNLGTAYFRLGEYKTAINYLKEGLDINTEIGDRTGIHSKFCSLGNAYLLIGEYRKALHYFKIALNICTEISDLSGMARNYNNLGNAHKRLGEYQIAINLYKTGLEISNAIGDKDEMLNNYSNQGTVYLCLRDWNESINVFNNSLQIATEMGDQSRIASSKCNLGVAYIGLREFETAITHCTESLDITTKFCNRFETATANGILGCAYLSLEHFEQATLHLMKSITDYDTIFLTFVPDQNRLSFVKRYFEFHQALMSCFIRWQRNLSGLLVIDLGKAKELHCCIEKQRNFEDKDTFGYARAIWNRIEKKEEQKETEEIQNVLHVAENHCSVLVFAFDVSGFLNVWILSSEIIFRTLSVRLEILVPLIEIFFGRLNVNLNRNSSFFNLDLVAGFASQIFAPLEISKGKVELQNIVENINEDNILEKLFELLIRPVKDALKGNKLIIVPDKQLFFAPFSALVDENGCFLSESYSIQITPSLHTLKSSMSQSNDRNISYALFVGNPTVGKVYLNGSEYTPNDLPGSAEEVEYLSELFEARPLLGNEATKQVVLQLLDGATIIHISAHGEASRGEIMLAPNPSCTKPDSGPKPHSIPEADSVPTPDSYLLAQEDILKLSIQARLVVLCCCHTGQGEISSEGVVGIARAFLAAGARSVLASLWPIDDQGTMEFMKKFYGELCQETSVCEALRRTMNFFQNHEKEQYRSMMIWAPFTIYGEDIKFSKHEIEKITESSYFSSKHRLCSQLIYM
jgi:CHAT domain-containing protein/tetratricopeptide (TPR) repeat protein